MLAEGRSRKAEWDCNNLYFFNLLLKAAAPLFTLLWIYTHGNDQIASKSENVTCLNYKKLNKCKILPTNSAFHLLLRFVGFNLQPQSSMLVDLLYCFEDRLWCWITLLEVFWKAWGSVARTIYFFLIWSWLLSWYLTYKPYIYIEQLQMVVGVWCSSNFPFLSFETREMEKLLLIFIFKFIM